MSIRPAVSAPADKHGVRRRSAALLGGFLLSLYVLSHTGQMAHAAGGDAPGILTKMKAVYHEAKTYRCTLVMSQNGTTRDGKAFTLTKTQQVEYKAPNLLHASIKLTGTGAAANAGNSVTLYADGKNIYQYYPSQKRYTKAPESVPVSIDQIVDLLRAVPDKATTGLSLLPDSTVKGHAVYQIAYTLQMPPSLPADKQKQWKEFMAKSEPIHYAIDKKSYLLLRLTQKLNGVALTVDLNDQTLNSNISSGTFTFTPPAGSKLYVPQMPPQGGIPGAPGGPGAGAPSVPGKPH